MTYHISPHNNKLKRILSLNFINTHPYSGYTRTNFPYHAEHLYFSNPNLNIVFYLSCHIYDVHMNSYRRYNDNFIHILGVFFHDVYRSVCFHPYAIWNLEEFQVILNVVTFIKPLFREKMSRCSYIIMSLTIWSRSDAISFEAKLLFELT